MIIKSRTESKQLKILRCLYKRSILTEKEVSNYLSLEKGFIGEQKFDRWLEGLSEGTLILSDLLLECNNTFFQIDTLIISQTTIYLIEIKNYEGDFMIEKDRWYTVAGAEIKNPLLQLERCEGLLRKLLHVAGYKTPIEAYLIFVNPEFHLYQAPLKSSIIFPTQLTRFIKKLNMIPSKVTIKNTNLAEKLISLHSNNYSFIRLPDYNFENIPKGITCQYCHSYLNKHDTFTLVCNKCNKKETIIVAVLRSVEEFKILFPEKRVTIITIYDWCKIIDSKKTIKRILATNYKQIGHGRSSYYI